jgi:hypothetical protein
MPELANMVSDLAKVQGSLPNIKKDAKGNFGKYVTLDAIHEAVLPLLSANNLAWVTLPTYDDDGEVQLEYKLLHTSGDKIEGSMKLFVSQPNMQQLGSAITYAKRYAICAVLGVTADEDDDGTSATAAPYKKPVAKVYPKKEVESDMPKPNELVDLKKTFERKGITDNAKMTEFVNDTVGSKVIRTKTELEDVTMALEMLPDSEPF